MEKGRQTQGREGQKEEAEVTQPWTKAGRGAGGGGGGGAGGGGHDSGRSWSGCSSLLYQEEAPCCLPLGFHEGRARRALGGRRRTPGPRPQAQEDPPGPHGSAVPILKSLLPFKQEASFSLRLPPPTRRSRSW